MDTVGTGTLAGCFVPRSSFLSLQSATCSPSSAADGGVDVYTLAVMSLPPWASSSAFWCVSQPLTPVSSRWTDVSDDVTSSLSDEPSGETLDVCPCTRRLGRSLAEPEPVSDVVNVYSNKRLNICDL